jgi:hypothetical protein
MPSASYDPVTGALLGTQRTLLAIYTDLQALTAAQKNLVWTDFTSGNPPKWSTDDTPGAGVVMALSVAAVDLTGLATAVQTAARMKMVAAYCLYNPKYLRNPAFDPTIFVSGYV